MKNLLIAFLIMFFGSLNFTTMANDKDELKNVEGLWQSEEGLVRFEVFKRGDQYFGKLAWIKKVVEDGEVFLDTKNPNPELRDRPVLGLEVLSGFRYKGNGLFGNGSIYDPESGHTYKCRMKVLGDGSAKVRGYIGIPLLGRTVMVYRYNE